MCNPIIKKKNVLTIARTFARQWADVGFQPTRVSCQEFLRRFEPRKITRQQQKFLQKRWDWQLALPVAKGKNVPQSPYGWQAMAHCYRWGEEAGIEDVANETYIFITRKSGKTAFAANVALATLLFSQNVGPRVYSLATKQEQARIVFEDGQTIVRRMARKEGGKKEWSEGFKALAEEIRYEENDGKWTSLPTDSGTLDGLQYELAIFDEAALVPDDVYNVIRSAMSSSVYGQHILGISTAGRTINNWFSKTTFEAIDRLEAGEKVGVNILVWSVPEARPRVEGQAVEYDSEQDWGKPEVWKKTHPTLGATITMNEIQKYYDSAKLNPTKENEFRRTRLNEFYAVDVTSMCTVAQAKTICNKDHDATVERKLSESRRCFIGVDVSSVWDPTSVAILCESGGRYYAKTQNFICRHAFRIKKERTRAKCLEDFREWGQLRIAGEDVIDYEEVKEYVQMLMEQYRVKGVFADRHTAGLAFRHLIQGDIGLPVVDIENKGLNRLGAINFFLDRLWAFELSVKGNDMFFWELGNAAVTEKPDGKRDIQKLDLTGDTPMTIDGVYAIVHAFYPYALAAKNVKKKQMGNYRERAKIWYDD